MRIEDFRKEFGSLGKPDSTTIEISPRGAGEVIPRANFLGTGLSAAELWEHRPKTADWLIRGNWDEGFKEGIIVEGATKFATGGAKFAGRALVGTTAWIASNPLVSLGANALESVGLKDQADSIRSSQQDYLAKAKNVVQQLTPEGAENIGYYATSLGAIIGTAGFAKSALATTGLAPFMAKYPLISSALTRGSIGAVYGQMTGSSAFETDVSAKAKELGKDFAVWTAFGLAGGIPAKMWYVAVPAYYAVGHVGAKLDGASDEDAISAGLITAAIGTASNIYFGAANQKSVHKMYQQKAESVFRQYGGKDFTKETYKMLAHQYHPDLPGSLDPTGAGMSKINAAWEVLKSPTFEAVNQSIFSEFGKLWKSIIGKPDISDKALMKLLVAGQQFTPTPPPPPVKPEIPTITPQVPQTPQVSPQITPQVPPSTAITPPPTTPTTTQSQLKEELDAVKPEVKPEVKAEVKPETKDLTQSIQKAKASRQSYEQALDEWVKGQHETTYRGASKAEWDDVQQTGKFKKPSDSRFIDKLTGKEIRTAGDEAINTSPDKRVADLYGAGSSKEGVVIEFKPEAKAKMKFSAKFDATDLKADEYLGEGLKLDDVARVTDKNGKVIYEATTGGKTLSQLKAEFKAEWDKPEVKPEAKPEIAPTTTEVTI